MKICVLTGKRGGFGAIRPMLRLMRDDPEFDLDLVTCDMHHREEFGDTWREVKEDFPDYNSISPRKGWTRPEELGSIARDMAIGLEDRRPDLLMLYGDRGESLAAAMVATEMCIPIAHLQGGDTSGTMDDRRRHAISQLSTLHFVSNTQSYCGVTDREIFDNVYEVGDSHLDPIFDVDYDTPSQVMMDLDLNNNPIIIVLHHPDPTDRIDDNLYFRNIMDAIDDPEKQFVLIYPCSDPGWEKVVQSILWFRGHENIQIHKNLPSRTFLGLMNIADCIVGNSSAGIIEAPYLDLPCVNVGDRQDGRLHADNVQHADHQVECIEVAFQTACKLKPPFKKLYGNGATGKRIIAHLKEWNNE